MIDKNRVQKIAAMLNERGSSAVFIGPSTDLEYIADIEMFSDERTKGLMISSKGECFALCPSLYKEEMRAAMSEAHFEIWEDHEGFKDAFRAGCRNLGVENGTIEINDGVLAVDAIDMMNVVPAKFVNGAHLLSPLRMRKDERELELMRRASEINDAVMEDVAGFVKAGVAEWEVRDFLLKRYDERGGEGPSFRPIIASGPGASMPHYHSYDRTIERGDFVIVDMGCRYKRYCSDMTRTFCVGEPTDEQRKIYDIVLKAQCTGEESIKRGVTGQDVDRASRKIIEDAGYGKYFFNRVGHGIGIAVHEGPYIIEGNDVPLEPGNVFSVEPGIYVEGQFGVRIEDLVAIREDGTAEILNHFTKELIVV